MKRDGGESRPRGSKHLWPLWINLNAMTNLLLNKIVAEIELFSGMTESLATLENFTVKLIASRLPHYNWVGFYWLDPDDAEMLVLGAYVGAPTEHTRIPISRGICGAAIAEDKTIIVDNVAADPRYLACSLETRSEIVAPIRAHGKTVGEIDIDSHSTAAFGPEDQKFVERCAEVIGAFIERA
jgi:L-methionine (R)-S-oxide reductase